MTHHATRPSTIARLEDLHYLLTNHTSAGEATARCGWRSTGSAIKAAYRAGNPLLARTIRRYS